MERTRGGRLRSAEPLGLGEAEPVPGVVSEERFDPVRPFGWFLEERDALRRQLLERLLAVGRLEYAAAERAFATSARTVSASSGLNIGGAG
jgi:hypothetical protein